MYSQNNEDDLILSYFGTEKKTVIEIGANDGKTLSNSLLLIENGWQAFLLEPSQKAFDCLVKLHGGNKLVHLYRVAIAETSEEKTYYESGELLGTGDSALVSSLDLNELKRWNGTVSFQESRIICKTWHDFLSVNSLDTTEFNFISIDAEGYDWIILEQINLTLHNCEMLCIEWNGISNLSDKFTNYANAHGLFEIHRNAENIIFARKK
jgi:FkbM family methyltransferase